jgi:iron complex outermembrane receptor protein
MLFSTVAFSQQFRGQVLDSLTKQPISLATVYVVELHTGATTNDSGRFVLSSGIAGQVHLQISCIGYQTGVFFINLAAEKERTFYLFEGHLQLSEVVVSTSSVKLQQDNIVSIVQKSISELNQNAPTNLTEAISSIPGVDNYSTGSGIGKPVIRGLSGNRIVVYAQNVRLENQQWGDEHGLGIGDVGIENVEVIKGASSLLYGADAIGGVLYFADERYAPLNSMQCFAASKFLSNTLGSYNDAGIKFNRNSVKVNLFGSYNSNADYQLPNFKRVLNTRFSEANFKTSLGYNHKNWIGNLRYSFLRNDFGITDTNILSTSAEHRVLLPFQKVDNHLLTFDNTFFFGRTKLTATFGYNQNNRKEFEDRASTPNLSLMLRTFNYHIKSNTSFLNDKLNLMTGIQGMVQQNTNKADEVLIPDAVINDIGAFAVLNYSPVRNLAFEGGVRFDNRNISTTEMQTPNTYFPKLKRDFYNFNYAIGSSYRIKKTVLRLNVASGFRAPNTSELLSNGVHEGTLRYEIGYNNLKSERATQVDFSVNYEQEHFSFYINPFFNHINNYIFLSPSDSVNNSLPVFYYRQTEANLFGGEVGFHWHPHPIDWLHIESNYSAVFAADKSWNALPLIPANKIQTTVKGEFKTKGKVKIESVFIEYIYRFSQTRIATYETSTPGYHLLNAGLVFQINSKNNNFEITAGVKNILNTKYTEHLSRFKQLGISNPGLNAYLGLRWNFHTSEK